MSTPFTKRLKRSLTYWFVRWCIFWFNLLPRWIVLWKGAGIGWLAWRFMPHERQKIDTNLKRVYGDKLSASERTRIGKQFFINSGKNIVEVVRFPRYFKSQIAPLVTVEGLDHFDRAYKARKGLIGITGHIGNFELLAGYISSLGYDIGVIGREMYDPRLDKLLIDNRASVGLTNFATTDSPKRIIQWLKDGKALGVLIDTDSMRVRGTFVPFFGIPANTPIGHAMIGLKVGASFLPMACVRTDKNRYKIIIKPPVEIPPTESFDEAVYQVTLLCSKALEDIINTYPDQWIWIHNRWNTTPPNTP
jgi:Kdo2-lipid IVA lauroyltransferase/acyltransferase